MKSSEIFIGLLTLVYYVFCFIGSAYLIKKHNGFRFFYNNLNKIFQYQGRVTGIEYASFVLIMDSINLLLELIFLALGNVSPMIDFIISLLFKLSTISVTTRRIHDLGYSGWLQTPMVIIGLYFNNDIITNNPIGFTFLFFVIIAFDLFLIFKKGQIIDNQYGKEI